MRFLLSLLILSVAFFAGCSSNMDSLADGTSTFSVDSQLYIATATHSVQEINGITYQIVTLETPKNGRVRIMAQSFAEGRFEMEQAGNSNFPYSVSYLNENEPLGHFTGTKGTIEIEVTKTGTITGEFEFETINTLSSNSRAEGPKIDGRFKAR